MISITADQLVAAVGCARGRAATWLPHFAATYQLVGICTPVRLAAYLAQKVSRRCRR